MVVELSPIVPIFAQLKYDINAVNEYIVKYIPFPVCDFASDPRLIMIHSFDVNKPGADVMSSKVVLPMVLSSQAFYGQGKKSRFIWEL
ncbi:uncharacterized protein BJ212DRAFT_659748 [Suillus subaureus]|uniref:Uncharacterized protein n=1 Tax=Suillus subaureus TaxID=48587 RepID=A0A9P7AQQ5_9AGAM|nr:uncharacterized protein BJ212DRAFT_659748 [Suillus subaureus]KAG1794470.1 hypothetical protein BJ212DRAFT_659748 [Suillus subaureus]